MTKKKKTSLLKKLLIARAGYTAIALPAAYAFTDNDYPNAPWSSRKFAVAAAVAPELFLAYFAALLLAPKG